MRIAIQVADLDHERIDGTRVYISNVLKYLGKLAPNDQFLLYHRNQFNPALVPQDFPNYQISTLKSPLLWTQTAFAAAVWKDKPDVLWMPMHNIPLIRRREMKTVITFHDLAFKRFPKTFPTKDRNKLKLLAALSVRQADKLIAVSESTKKDILEFYPKISEQRISVVHHGFDTELFQREISGEKINEVLKSYKLEASNYLLYVGAIQPRKNLITLVSAFEIINKKNPDLKLVIVGEKAWMSEQILQVINRSVARDNIVLTGAVPFADLPLWYQQAKVFVFPELYAGFGIPILEAMASGVPVIAANNSSLPEVGGNAASYFESKSSTDLVRAIEEVLGDEKKQSEMIRKGIERVKEFSWERCARETLNAIHSALD